MHQKKQYYNKISLFFNNGKKNQEQLDNALFKKLEELTIKIPSDPALYTDHVQKYSKMYKEELDMLLGDIQKKHERFSQLLIFLAKGVQYYSKILSYVPAQVIDLLENHGPNLHPHVRRKCVGAIMILRAKNILYPVQTIKFLFSLFNIEDKELRKVLYKYILNDIRRMNIHHKNVKINQQIRSYIHDHLLKHSDKMAQKTLQMMIDLYKRNIWTDNRSVNIISDGCFNQSNKIKLIAAHFLMSTTEPLEEMEESSDEDAVNPSDIKFKKGITKHTKNKEKKIEKDKKKAARRLRKKEVQGRKCNFMPIDLIYNPQDFSEKLFNIMAKKNTKFTHKIIFMSLVARLIWRHRLIILPFYGSVMKYLEPKQKEVPKVLTYFAESVHELVPDDEIEAIISHIIEKFVNDRCSEFAMTIGLNTIRQVYFKLPYLMNEEKVQYLSGYYEYKNKNVRMAAKALINMIRDINPEMLPKKYRAKNQNEQNSGIKKIGVKEEIDGAELLEHNGDIPIYMDKVLTDEDFKKIRKLKRKKQQAQQWKDFEVFDEYEYLNNKQNEHEDLEQVDQQKEEGNENVEEEEDEYEEQDNEEEQQESQLSEDEEIDDDGQEIEFQDDQIEGWSEVDEEQVEQDEEESSEVQIDQSEGQEEQQIQPSKRSKKDIISDKKKEKQQERLSRNNKKKIIQFQSDDSDSEQIEESQDPNPHGFLNVDQIAYYKKSKTQIKAERKQNKEKQPKFKHKPKQKGGGTTNKEKQKMKPLLMLRAKKNRIRSQEKQVKLTIKSLKNKLGKVRSGKQAKKLKNQKIKKIQKS